MTRINTNISALTAQQNLANSNNQLQVTLTRLSTGLRINSAADDPAGMIAATDLGANISATQQAISNSQVASQMISTADSALSQISTLLTTINGLVTQAANTSSMSSSQIAANQLQIDSSLNAINSIAQTTTFQGQNLLDGSLGFLTSGTSANYASTVQNLQVTQANMGVASTLPVDIKVTAAAKQAAITNNIPSTTGALGTLQLTGGSITVTAPSGSPAYNNAAIKVVSNDSVTNTAPTAVWTAGTTTNGVTTPGTLTVTVDNTGTTSAAAIASAITNATDGNGNKLGFTVAAGYSGNFIAGTTATSAQATTNSISIGGGTLTIAANSLSNAFNNTNVDFVTTGTSATPTVSYTAGSGSTAGTLSITVDGSQSTSLTAIANAINQSTDPTVQQFAATVGGTAGAVLDPTQYNGKTGVAAVAGSATVDIGGPTVAGGTGGIGLVITANSTGTSGNGLQINVVEGAAGASTSATYNSDYTTGGANGLLTITLAQGNGAPGTVTKTTLLAALANGTITNSGSKTFASNFSASFTADSATSIQTPNTSASKAATSVTATTSGGSSASATVNVTDGTAIDTGTFTLTANNPGTGPAAVTLSVASGTTTAVSYSGSTLTITLSNGSSTAAGGAVAFTDSTTALANLQTLFQETAIGSSFTLSNSFPSGGNFTEGTAAAQSVVLNNTPVAAAASVTVTGGSDSAVLVATATNPGAAGNGLVVSVVEGAAYGASYTAASGGNPASLTLTVVAGFTASSAQVASLQSLIAADTPLGSQYTLSTASGATLTTGDITAGYAGRTSRLRAATFPARTLTTPGQRLSATAPIPSP